MRSILAWWFVAFGGSWCLAGVDPAPEPYLLRELAGDAPADRFGAAVMYLEDAKGRQLVLIGAPAGMAKEEPRGYARLYRAETGELLRGHHGKEAGDEFGFSLAWTTIHPFGPDAVAAYVIGAPGGGYARAYSIETGKKVATFEAGVDASVRFGHTMTSAWPKHELAVGAPGDDSAGTDSGSVWLFAQGILDKKLPGPSAGARAGTALIPVGYVPFPPYGFTGKLLVGAPEADHSGGAYGEVLGYFIETGEVGMSVTGPTGGAVGSYGATILEHPFKWSGPGISIPGASVHLVIGDPDLGAGRVEVYPTNPLTIPEWTLTGDADGDRFGAALAAMRNGLRSLLAIGAPGASSGAGLVRVVDLEQQEVVFEIHGSAGDELGAGMPVWWGDVDGDGRSDMMVGMPGSSKVRLYRMDAPAPGVAFTRDAVLDGEIAGVDDVDVATIEAVKGMKLKLRFQATGVDPVSLRVRVLDPSGEPLEVWKLKKVGAKPVKRKVTLDAPGEWTVELSSWKGSTGGYRVFTDTKLPSAAQGFYVSDKAGKAAVYKQKLQVAAGATAHLYVDPDDGGEPKPAFELIQPDGTPYPDLDLFDAPDGDNDVDLGPIPILQSGKHIFRVTPADKKAKHTLYGGAAFPWSPGVVLID